jgi:hypothetical protein|tara:strand:- start:416 stop:802 length:387 start_codon:yes stop_codon:yes gene_type:complete
MKSSITIQVFCEINPSEDIEKIKTVIFNLFPELKIKIEGNTISGNSNDLELLSKVLASIQNRKIKNVFLRILNSNIIDNSTWFYLNKQAAFVNVVALCNEADESALGPIKVVLESNDIEKTIETIISG